MSCMHERLRAVFNQYATRFLDEKTRNDHGIEPDVQRLVLPGEEGTDGECDFAKMFDGGISSMNNKDSAIGAKIDTDVMPIETSVVMLTTQNNQEGNPSNNQDEEEFKKENNT